MFASRDAYVREIVAHNNMQMAMSNTVTAIIENCNMLDVIQNHIHPRSAIKWMASENKDDFVTFMKEMHDYELLE